MFENLKNKLKGFLKKTPEKVEVEEVTEVPLEEVVEVEEPKVERKIEEPKEETVEEKVEKPEPEPVEEKVEELEPEPLEEKVEAEKPKKRGFLEKITRKRISVKSVDALLWDLELALLENDVAKDVTEKICAETKQNILESDAKGNIETLVKDSIRKALESILSKEKPDILKLIDSKEEKPFVIVFFGFNGSGKTLTIGKFAKLLKDKGYSVVLAAGDTFRAAAIEQLDVHAKTLGVPIIKQNRGSDAAAVIFDAVKHAKAKGIQVVLADTAGRAHTDINLMDELKKVVRVNNPDLKIFVGDSLTGNDAADQAREFNAAVGIDLSVLNKVDCDAKGGSCISVAYVTEKPIIYLGTGQGYDDMIEFESNWFLGKIF